jgi:hypothetical protein
MGSFKNLKGACKVQQGTGVECLIIAANDLSNTPKTVFEKDGAETGYTAVVGDKVKIAEAFTYVQDKAFAKFTLVPDSGNVMSELIGETGFQAFKNGFKGMLKGVGDAQREWLQDLADSCGGAVVLIPRRDGDYNVFGSKNSPVVPKAKLEGGSKAGDKSGIDIEFEDNSGLIYRTYPKALNLTVLPD